MAFPWSIDVDALSDTISADALAPSVVTNPADKRLTNNYWTPGNTKYLTADSDHGYILESLDSSRDLEVITWARVGRVFMRVDANGSGWFFGWHYDAGDGVFDIGLATITDLTTDYCGANLSGAGNSRVYRNTDLTGTVPGFSNSEYVTNHRFKLGVNGLDIYAYFSSDSGVNWMPICTFRDYRHMVSGKLVIEPHTTYGFRSIAASVPEAASFYSDPPNLQVDMRDFGMRPISTTGSISAGSNLLYVDTVEDWKLGDWVIVELGGEATFNGRAAGMRGTKGVGGYWPEANYANYTAMSADTSKESLTYGWTEDDGKNYQYDGYYPNYTSAKTYNTGDRVGAGDPYINYESLIDNNTLDPPTHPAAWQALDTSTTWVPMETGVYYIAMAIPFALHGRVLEITSGGATLVLDKNATVSSTSANVHLDNQPILNYITAEQYSTQGFQGSDLRPFTPDNLTVILPTGDFAGAGQIQVAAKGGWTFQGQGQENTRLFSPKGAYSFHFVTSAYDHYTFSDFTLEGNFGDNGFGLTTAGWTYLPGGLTPEGWMVANDGNDLGILTQTSVPQGYAYPPGIYINGGYDSVVQDVTVKNVSQKAVGCDWTANCWAYRVTAIQTVDFKNYMQWLLGWGNSTGGGCVDCSIISDTLTSGYEAFASDGVQFIRCTSVNALWSINNSGNWLVKDCETTITTGSQSTYVVVNNPILNVSKNFTGSSFGNLDGMIDNTEFIMEEGGVNADHDYLAAAIIVNNNCPDSDHRVTIKGGSYIAPDYEAPSAMAGPVGINSTGPATYVDGFACSGQTKEGSGYANINVSYGSVINCYADSYNLGEDVIQSPPNHPFSGWPGPDLGQIILGDHVLDFGLAAFADADGIYLCSQQPTDYTDASSTHAVGSKLESAGGIFSAIFDATGGRRVSLNEITDGDCSTGTTATHWAAVDSSGQFLLATGPLDEEKTLTIGWKFALPSFAITLDKNG